MKYSAEVKFIVLAWGATFYASYVRQRISKRDLKEHRQEIIEQVTGDIIEIAGDLDR
jgi:hypothetical protein